MDFQELIEYVEKRKPLPEDSGRSSSMTLSRGSPSNLAGKKLIFNFFFSKCLNNFKLFSNNEILTEKIAL